MNKKSLLSFEFFPENKYFKLSDIQQTIDKLALFNPDFISITYGAGGSQAQNSFKLCDYTQNVKNLKTVAHLTAIDQSKAQINETILQFKQLNVSQILALRGDIKKNDDAKSISEFVHASDLLSYLGKYQNLTLHAACYPEGHPENSLAKDIEYLKLKQANGATSLMSQLFFDNGLFYNFLEQCLKTGVTLPVIAGILPISTIKQIETLVTLCHSSIPASLFKIMDQYADKPEEFAKASLEFSVRQVDDLLKNGVAGIHLYTMNRSETTEQLLANLNHYFKKHSIEAL